MARSITYKRRHAKRRRTIARSILIKSRFDKSPGRTSLARQVTYPKTSVMSGLVTSRTDSQLVFRHMQNHASNPAPESDKGADRTDQDGQGEAEWRSSVRCSLKEGLVVSI